MRLSLSGALYVNMRKMEWLEYVTGLLFVKIMFHTIHWRYKYDNLVYKRYFIELENTNANYPFVMSYSWAHKTQATNVSASFIIQMIIGCHVNLIKHAAGIWSLCTMVAFC